MNIYLLLIAAAFLISIVCGFVSTPLIIDFCKRKHIYDAPNARKMHKEPIPRLGGVLFLPAMLLTFVVVVFLLGKDDDGRVEVSLWSVIFFISLLIIYLTGLIDDFLGLDAKVKFVAQAIAACLLPVAGLYINNLYGLFGIHQIPSWVGIPLTVFVIVFICNAMNLIDGIDGLCACLSELALGGFLYGFYCEKVYAYCILIAGLMGVLFAYLQFNLFGKAEKGTKIFMGDSGSLTLGFILAFLFVKMSSDNPNVMSMNLSRMPFAMSLLVVPVFDVARVIIHRMRTHWPIFKADKNHIHHKLMRAGLSMRQALVAIVALAVFFIVVYAVVFPLLGFTWLLVIDVALFTLFHYLLDLYTLRLIKKERRR